MESWILEKERKVPVLDQCSTLVVGGGVAGVSAAIAAARGGSDVILLEREFALGGLATLGLITIYLPLCDGRGSQMIYGLGEELLRLSIRHGAERNYPSAWLDGKDLEERKKKRFMTQFNPQLFALELERLLGELGVRILYGSTAVGVEMGGNRIEAVIIENKSGRSAMRVNTVIDCSGDGDICRLSGAETREYEAKNGLASWYYYHSKGQVNLKMFGLADVVPQHEDQGSATGNETVEVLTSKRYSGTDGAELSEMVLDAHRHMFADILKKREEDPQMVPVTMSMIPLVRMTRRLAGAYALDDKETEKSFADSIGTIGDWRKCGPVYEIPFRCLYGNTVRNLLAAGRCISVTDAMWDITRVIPVCAVTGEAAGTAAALGDDFPALPVEELQRKLESQHVRLHLAQDLQD